MGNYCSTSKDNDNVSEKSEESPAYQKVDNTTNPPVAEPEILADSSTISNSVAANGAVNNPSENVEKSNIQTGTNTIESASAVSPPCDEPQTLNLPETLSSFYGKSKSIEKSKKVVLYMLSADDGNQTEKAIIFNLQNFLQDKYSSKGFEVHICDLHTEDNFNSLDPFNLKTGFDCPLESRYGHHLLKNCLYEIKRHLEQSYVIPLLFLNNSLGDLLLPLSIEKDDFAQCMQDVDNCGKLLLEKWYQYDDKIKPACYRVKADKIDQAQISTVTEELNTILKILADSSSTNIKHKYLKTTVEQEINTVLQDNPEILKRLIWIQNTSSPNKTNENSSSTEAELNQKLSQIQNDLKNQLSDKHILRFPVVSTQQQEQFGALLEVLLTSEIDAIIDDHLNKYQISFCTYGVDRRLLSELEEINGYSAIMNKFRYHSSKLNLVKDYLNGNSMRPLIITGSGKSVYCAQLSQLIHDWKEDSTLVLRYANLTPNCSDLTSLLATITEQISVLVRMTPTKCDHTLHKHTTELKNLMETSKQPITIIIDSIDEILDLNGIEWLPIELPNNVKIILTVSSNAKNFSEIDNDSNLMKSLKNKIKNEKNFVFLDAFTSDQWCESELYNEQIIIPAEWKKSNIKDGIQSKILWWLAWMGKQKLENLTISSISNEVFEVVEQIFGHRFVSLIFSLLTASRDGLLETEIVNILQNSKNIEGSESKKWAKFCWIMTPFLLHNKTIKIMDSIIKSMAIKRYNTLLSDAHKILHAYFEKLPNILYDAKKKEKCYNLRKHIELPYHSFKVDKILFETSNYLTDLSWIHNKIDAIGCVHFLHDIYLIHPPNQSHSNLPEHLKCLKKFLELYFKTLNYDAQQLYSLLLSFIKKEKNQNQDLLSNSIIKNWMETIENQKILRIEKIGADDDSTHTDDDDGNDNSNGHDFIMNCSSDGNFVISMSTDREEICVWDVAKCCKVRTLRGVPQPTSICPVGEFGIAVLCKREIKVIDLDDGKFKVTLKGVMNVKMPYFGVHDSQHLVCLSRNRMYVNLMNLESGDCVTTFKAGEDRFLNSLLVSGDGRILVCGDETQKPFPLLVWHLTQRKLLYDLRIPHHDFLTSLSAITHEGSYVCVVAKELAEPTPNFIVVYDLQSGTLFKKWKPSCNTVSLAISQSNTCVIAGLEDARILIWDLVTGNCRCSLIGHNAPVTLLKLDPLGNTLLSGDKEGRDKSIRLWDLNSGSSLAVYTPSKQITACELVSNGKYIILGLKNNLNLVTLKLRGGEFENMNDDNNITYGNPENDGKEFDLSK